MMRGPAPRHKEDDQVVYIDNDSAPRIIMSGEDLLVEDLPVGTRVVYPKPPIEGLVNPEAAIRYALNHPHDMDPLYAQLEPGMKVTIAVDDISLPLPPMVLPDIRQTMIEILLEQLDANGVDDVHIVIANSLHRRLTPWEMKRMVGEKIFNGFYPDRYYNHDAEDPDGMVQLGETRHHEPVRINRRAVESDLVIYVNINLVPMDGGHKSVTVGLCDYQSLRPHHEPETIRKSDSYMDPKKVHAEHQGQPHGQAGGRTHERVPHRDGPEQPYVQGPDGVLGKERRRVRRHGSGQARGHALGVVQDARGRQAQGVPKRAGALRAG